MVNNCVIVGDIRKSRNLKHWSKVYKKWGRVLEEVNSGFSDSILINFKTTVGDEFQGALVDSKDAYTIYTSLKSKLKHRLSVEIYCGVGIGNIERPHSKDITAVRGSAFYLARNAIELCKKKKRMIIVRSSDTATQIDQVINTFLYFIEVLENSWTNRQKEVINYYRDHQKDTYEELGKHFNVSKQSISQILKAANWDVVFQGETLVNELLYNLSDNKKISVKDKPFTNKSKANELYKEIR